MKKTVLIVLLLLWAPMCVLAATYQVLPNVAITIPDLPASWKATTEAPEEMVEHIAEHVKEEAQYAGKMMTDKEALEQARQRLKREELILFSEKSEAHILISFEARGDGEKVPTQGDVKLSAQYAVSGVGDEGWVDVNARYLDSTVQGAQAVQRFSIDYKHEDEPGFFNGLVGYAEPFWFWVYAIEHGEDPTDRATIDGILSNLIVRVK